MKKWLAVIVVLLLLILVLAPGGMGIIAQKRIKDLAQNWPANSPFSIKVLSYDRGWFSSTMQLDVTVTNPAHNPPVHVFVNESIVHGPVIISLSSRFIGIGQAYAHGEFVVPEDQQALFKQYIDQTNLVTNCLFLHLFGSVTVKLNVPEMTITNPADPQTKVIIEGLSTVAKISPRAAHISSQSVMQSLTWQDAASTMIIDNLHGHSNLSKTVEGLWLGDINLDLDGLAYNSGSKTLFSLKNAEYKSTSKEKDGLVSGNNHLSFESLTLQGSTYGPAEVAVNVQNVNAEPLAQLKRLAKVMQQQDGSGLAAQYTKRTERLVLKTIARGMQLTVNPISMQTPNGEITGQLNISMPNLLDDASGKTIKHPHVTIGQLIGGAQGSLQFSVPKVIVLNSLQNTILDNMKAMSQMLGNDASKDASLTAAAQQRASAQLQGWVAAGLLIENGTNYQFNAAYQQGKLLVNGKPIFNPAFGAPAMPMPTMGGPAPAMNAQPTSGTSVPAVVVPAQPAAQGSAPAGSSAPADQGSAPTGSSAPADQGSAPADSSVPADQGSVPADSSASATSDQSSMPAAAPMPPTVGTPAANQ
jgi:uncharacterized protein YdgA (DUF945 family)